MIVPQREHGPPGAAVDPARLPAVRERVAHQPSGRGDGIAQHAVLELSHALPTARCRPTRAPPTSTCSRSPRRAAGPGAPRRATASPAPRSRPTAASTSNSSASTSWPSRRRFRVSSVSTGPFQSTPSSVSPRSTSHGRPVRCLPARLDPPATGHPQVAADDEPALEAEQQVLADRLDRLEHAAVDTRRDLRRLGARVRRLDLEPLADERLQPQRRTVERVALGHDAQLRASVFDACHSPCPHRACAAKSTRGPPRHTRTTRPRARCSTARHASPLRCWTFRSR